jgi:hypothetical protein
VTRRQKVVGEETLHRQAILSGKASLRKVRDSEMEIAEAPVE